MASKPAIAAISDDAAVEEETTPTLPPPSVPLPRSLPIPIPQKSREEFIPKLVPLYVKLGFDAYSKQVPETPEEEREYFRQIRVAAMEAGKKKGPDVKVKVVPPPQPEEAKESGDELRLDFGSRLKNIFKKLLPKAVVSQGTKLDKAEDAVEWQKEVGRI